jgi:phosphonate transport system ATP-binding protein
LHQVDAALANFPRIIGLRAGELVFDLPSAQVTPAMLQALYGDAVDEMSQPALNQDFPLASPLPAVMHCR